MTGTTEFWTSRLDELKRLVSERWTASQIGQHFGVSRNAIIGICGRKMIALQGARTGWHGAPPPKRRPKHPKLSNGTRAIARARAVAQGTAKPKPRAALPVEFDQNIPTISLLDLGPKTCRWPIGNPGQPGFGFCGQDNGGNVYCAHHAMISRGVSADRRIERSLNYLARGV